MPESQQKSAETRAYLPDFCHAGTLLISLVVAELVAIVLTLASYERGQFLTDLSTLSMFILWMVVLGNIVLCRIKPWAERQGHVAAFIICFWVLELLFLLMAELTWRITAHFQGILLITDTHADFLIKTFLISAIVVALAMRYLYVSSEWRRSILLEAQSRISALQALIRPHFLFNSMNTIAALTRSNPQQAEEAVEDLADLLRANLGVQRNHATLKEELETAAIYQRIEKHRLGDRLQVNWEVGDLPMRAQIPSLTIQPLLENAIYHGIESLEDGGTVTVQGKVVDNDLQIVISNPRAANRDRHKGNQMALSNIRQRFELAYGRQASINVEETDDQFSVRLQFPQQQLSG